MNTATQWPRLASLARLVISYTFPGGICLPKVATDFYKASFLRILLMQVSNTTDQ